MTSEGSLRLFKQLLKMKKEAIAKVKEMVTNIHIEEVEVTGVHISPSESVHDLEECEIFLHMDLLFTIDGVSNGNMEKLMKSGNITILDYSTSTHRRRIAYATSYVFEYDEGKVTSSFSGIG